MSDSRKPPLGRSQRYLWLKTRHSELSKSIKTNLTKGISIRPKWLKEYNQVTEELRRHNTEEFMLMPGMIWAFRDKPIDWWCRLRILAGEVITSGPPISTEAYYALSDHLDS